MKKHNIQKYAVHQNVQNKTLYFLDLLIINQTCNANLIKNMLLVNIL